MNRFAKDMGILYVFACVVCINVSLLGMYDIVDGKPVQKKSFKEVLLDREPEKKEDE